ncbi:MAG: haloacid dehalogenase [Opitutae bacterium]|nr:haloacid dehalogenase [Opitutae bacterium]|tara:strand:- start:334 stop:1008 length:675 start_codon:yes stop_codon:yes gene_type:complete
MLTKMKIRAILFDLDGTLIDQFEAIHRAFSKTLITMGFPSPSFEKVKRAVGGASDTTMVKLIGPERATEAVSILRPIFEQEMFNGLHCLPGTLEGLQLLHGKGFKCAVLTNKYGPHARAACKHLGFDPFLAFTIGANDTKWKKPNTKLTQLAIRKLGFSPSETIYVGDSPYDFETAKNAGIRCHLIATGTHSKEELLSLQPGEVHNDFESFICSFIKSLQASTS